MIKLKMLKRENKKGWIRIAEAFLAITLLAGVMIVMYTKNIEKTNRGNEISNFEKGILEEIAASPEMRDAVLRYEGAVPESEDDIANITIIRNFIATRMPAGFEFEIKICKIDVICNLENYKEEVFARERVISASLTIYEPKKVKIFMWIK